MDTKTLAHKLAELDKEKMPSTREPFVKKDIPFSALEARKFASEMHTQSINKRAEHYKYALQGLEEAIKHDIGLNTKCSSVILMWAVDVGNPEETFGFLELLTDLGYLVNYTRETLKPILYEAKRDNHTNTKINITVKWFM